MDPGAGATPVPVGERLDATGLPLAPTATFAPTFASESSATVGGSGSGFVGAWAVASGSGKGLWLRGLDPTGASVWGPAHLYPGTTVDAGYAPLITSMGGAWLASWRYDTSTSTVLYGSRVTNDGVILDPSPLSLLSPGMKVANVATAGAAEYGLVA